MIVDTKAGTSMPSAPPMTLAITFQGPFLFDFKNSPNNDPNATVDVYAPCCPYHEAGFFVSDFSYSETDLWARANGQICSPIGPSRLPRRYVIHGNGIQPCSTVPTQICPVQLPPTNPKPANDPLLKPGIGDYPNLNWDKVLFQVTVPRPWLIYPLFCDMVNVVKQFVPTPSPAPGGEPSPNVQVYGTGLRFYYPWDSRTKIWICPPAKDPQTGEPAFGDPDDLTPPAAGNCSLLPELGEIEIRYQGLGLQDRNDAHSDARDCFNSLAVLAGLNEWWLNYEDGKATPSNPSHPYQPVSSGEAHTGGDCGAPVIALGIPSTIPSDDSHSKPTL